jgi:hypothetical protein
MTSRTTAVATNSNASRHPSPGPPSNCHLLGIVSRQHHHSFGRSHHPRPYTLTFRSILLATRSPPYQSRIRQCANRIYRRAVHSVYLLFSPTEIDLVIRLSHHSNHDDDLTLHRGEGLMILMMTSRLRAISIALGNKARPHVPWVLLIANLYIIVCILSELEPFKLVKTCSSRYRHYQFCT